LVAAAIIAGWMVGGSVTSAGAAEIDRRIDKENAAHGVKTAPMPAADDLSFLRRIYVDMISRIPTVDEIKEFQSWPAAERREKIIDKLMNDDRFIDRWTVFFEDQLRLRTQATGGASLIAFVHQAIADNMPYDEMCRRLLTANGKAGRTPEVGFILGDDAEPMAMARVTSQVFLGIRIGCAECHDHPFDKWKREDFYGMAAYFGKTRRIESQLTRVVYTTEAEQSTVLWPPAGDGDMKDRKPMTPRFPFPMAEDSSARNLLVQLAKLREPKKPANDAKTGPSVDDLLADADVKVKSRTQSKGLDEVAEAKKDIRKIDIQGSLYSRSELRAKLAEQITNPRNRAFSRNLVNRVWRELIGRGFVEPVDDFKADNPPSHPEALDYLADDFVAHGFDLRHLIRSIVTSDVYRRGRAPREADDSTRQELEVAFLATPMKRMISEAIYDSIVTAGHLFDFKHPAGANEVVYLDKVRVPVMPNGKPGAKGKVQPLLGGKSDAAGMMAMKGAGMAAGGKTYAVEDAIEVDFAKVLAESENEVEVEKMAVMSREELEANRMLEERMKKGEVEYVEQTVKRVVDQNPKFNTSLKMESPAPPGHFLRVFGQPTRVDLGEARDESASMRQALVMLNGKLTHEASRVGPLEPVHAMLMGDKADVEAAIKISYLEIMTRQPSAEELAEAKEIVAGATDKVEGMADLRWVLLNCNEFRFLP